MGNQQSSPQSGSAGIPLHQRSFAFPELIPTLSGDEMARLENEPFKTMRAVVEGGQEMPNHRELKKRTGAKSHPDIFQPMAILLFYLGANCINKSPGLLKEYYSIPREAETSNQLRFFYILCKGLSHFSASDLDKLRSFFIGCSSLATGAIGAGEYKFSNGFSLVGGLIIDYLLNLFIVHQTTPLDTLSYNDYKAELLRNNSRLRKDQLELCLPLIMAKAAFPPESAVSSYGAAAAAFTTPASGGAAAAASLAPKLERMRILIGIYFSSYVKPALSPPERDPIEKLAEFDATIIKCQRSMSSASVDAEAIAHEISQVLAPLASLPAIRSQLDQNITGKFVLDVQGIMR